jgi:hypothetical protein
MLLIYPPVARGTEPPLGIARLAGELSQRGVPVRCLDLSAEGTDLLLARELPAPASSAAALALKRRDRNAALLRSGAGYGNPDRYRRAVGELSRALKEAGAAWAASGGRPSVPSLADYREAGASPTSRSDLIAAAADWRANVFAPLYEARLREAAEAGPIDVVGISLAFLSQALCAFALAGCVRELFPRARIVFGGGLVTSWVSQGSLDRADAFNGFADLLLPGRGEDALGVLLEFAGGTAGGGIYPAAPKTFPSKPVPPGLPDFSDFAPTPYFAPVPILPFNFSWGCPWKRCTFCPEVAEDAPYAGLRAAAAVDQARALGVRRDADGRPPGLLHFTDNEIGPLYLSALAASPPPAPWYGFARFSARLLDADYCAALARSGCLLLQLGLESADQRVLDELGKGTRVEEIDLILANLRSAGIGVYLYVLFGTPAEDRDAALRTRDFVAARADRIDFMNVAVFNLPVASAEARRLATRPFYAGDLSLYREFEHPSGWHRGAVRDFLSRDFESDPSIKSILLRNPPVFTSSHAPFFLPRRLRG